MTPSLPADTERLRFRRMGTGDLVRGKGYATEAGRAALAWGFEALDLPYVTAMVQPDNTASIGVAQSLGMSPIRTDELLGAEVVVYAISREKWQRS